MANNKRTNLEDVLHVVFQWIDAVVGEDQQVFDQTKSLNLVLDDLLLERIQLGQYAAGRLCRAGTSGSSEHLGASHGGSRQRTVDDGKIGQRR